MADKPPSGLHRSLGSLQVQLISLGAVIGSSYFLGLGETVAKLGPSIVLAFMLGGVIVWLVGLAMGELCAEMPREGSFVSFAKELVGPEWAAGVGWSYWIDWCAYIASEMIGGGLLLHQFVPSVPAFAWTAALAAAVTVLNLLEVELFAAVESALSLIKVAAVAGFALFGAWVWLRGGLGFSLLTGGRGWAGFFPAGAWAVPLSMVLVLVNYAGTEVVALASAETADSRRIARDCRRMAASVVALFVIPLLVLVAIFPHAEGSLERSIFSAALERHGLGWAAALFSFVALTAAFSCATSGFYGTVRTLYGLGREGLAPAATARLNGSGVPSVATWVTIVGCWAFFPLYAFFQGTAFYTWLLAVSGFAGGICWLSISWCQLRWRRKTAGRAPLWSYAAVGLQLAVLGLIPFSAEFRGCLWIALPALLLPMALVRLRRRRAEAPALPEPA